MSIVFRRRLLGAGFATLCVTAAALGNVYPSGLAVDSATVNDTCGLARLTYILNEDADGTVSLPGVKIEVLNASNVAVRTVTIPRQLKGTHVYYWDGRNDAGARVANGSYSFRVTAADNGYAAWTQISSDSNKYVRFPNPRGVAVNTNPASPYYGRTYVTNALAATVAAVSRNVGVGVYVLNADQSDAVGQDDTALTGGVGWTGGGVSPYKISVGPDDRPYIGDWSDAHSGIWSTDPNVSGASGVEVLDSTGRNAAGLNAVHGSITSRPIVTGTLAGGNMVIYAVDEDFVPLTSLWKWTVGAGPLPHAGAPALVSDLPLSVISVTADVDIGPNGNIYLTQYRSNGTEPGLWVLSPDGTTVLFDSLAESRTLLGNPTAVDLLREARAPKVSPDGNWVAVVKHFSMTDLMPLDANGVPILSARQTIPTGTVNIGRDVGWDNAGNLYVATSGHAALRIWSPPTGAHSNVTTAASFSLNKPGSGGPTISAQPQDAAFCPNGNANFSVTASGSSLTYQWQKNGLDLVDGPNVTGATTANLSLTSVPASDNGAVIRVKVCASDGVVLSNIALLRVGVAFSPAPQSQTVCVNTNATFMVQATGVGTLSYQWQKDTAGDNNFANIGGATTNSVVLSNVQTADSGTRVRVIVTDDCGPTTSPAAVMTVSAGPTMSSVSGNKTAPVGGSATYSVTAVGSGTVTYQWYKTVGDVSTPVGANSPFLNLTNVACADTGAIISVAVTDECGTTNANVGTLTVGGTAEVCNNGVDDDCDGNVDCEDSDCDLSPLCVPPCNAPFADADGDGDVDMDDFGEFQVCFTGPSGDGFDRDNCYCFDRDANSAVDAGIDLADFMACASGADVPADPACDDFPTGNVVINEIQYDEWGTADVADTREFVELYNRDASPVNISGWRLRAPTMAGRDVLIPGTPGIGSTIIPGHGYYVIGSPSVPLVNVTISPSTDYWENDREALELVDANGTVKDTVVYERSAGAVAGLAVPEGGIWGPLVSTSFALQGWSRWVDGEDTNSNGRDFGLRVVTPGESNNSPVIAAYAPPNVDGEGNGAQVSGLTGSFVHALVIDPADTTLTLGTDDVNPNVIPASPQGGKAIIAWDPSGGGNLVVSNEIMTGNGSYDLWVYLDTSDITIAGAETTAYGLMGTADPLFNTPDPGGTLFPATNVTVNGCTGVAWIFQKDNAGNVKRLFLVDAGAGGDSSPNGGSMDWVVHQAIDMSAVASGWYRLSISYTGATGAVQAKFGAQTYNFNTAAGLKGGFYVGYRESLAGTPTTLRPPTFDMVP